MQRRTFISGLAASIALGTQIASAQRTSRAGTTVVTSEFTGATIDFTDSGLELIQIHVDSDEGVEHAHFQAGDVQRFDINFVPKDLFDAGDYARGNWEMWRSNMSSNLELLDDQSFEDGGYLIWTYYDKSLVYYEYQYGSYADHDIVTFLHIEKDKFLDYFAKAQLVTVDDLPPMLFTEESSIASVAEQFAAGTATSSQTTATRTTRSTRNSPTTETSTPSADVGAVAAVIAHRDAFWASYEEFFALLEIMGDESATDIETRDAWAAMANISLDWQQYPKTAATLAFSPSEADLESAYIAWADQVGEMGVSFEQYFMGAAEVDDFIALMEELEVLDADLATILDGLASLGDNKLRAAFSAQKNFQVLGERLHRF